jgi:hypothetical protein
MRASVSLLVVLGVFVLMTSSSADIPQVMSYQGKVTDGGGTPVPDGNYQMRFRIMDAPTGANVLWDSGTRTVAVSGGVFNVLLGDSPQPTLNLDFDQDYWLLITFQGLNQTPRQRLASAGYAYMASGLVAGTAIIGSVTDGPYFAAIAGSNTAPTGSAFGLYGESSSTSGMGVFGTATATTGVTYGLFGGSTSTSGRAVYGFANAGSGTTYGVYGMTISSEGTGVRGHALGGTGATHGVSGQSDSENGRGVYGLASATTGSTYGGYFESSSSSGKGVYGKAGSGTGVQGYSTTGTGVEGYGRTYGVYGRNPSSNVGSSGVYGYASGTTGLTYGAHGLSNSPLGFGVYGSNGTSGNYSYLGGYEYGAFGYNAASGTYGVLGGWEYGVYGGHSDGSYGQLGSNGLGAFGWSASGDFGWVGGNGTGAYGYNAATGFVGMLGTPSYGVYYSGGLGGTGPKNCIVKTSLGPTKLYCQESPECWFEDFGRAKLEDGIAHVELDALFLETVTINEDNPLNVFLQPQDPDCKGLAAVPGATGFDAVELLGGSSNGWFSYRAVAKRKGFEEKRLDYCKAAETDSYLYPELREKELKEHGMERVRIEEERRRIEEKKGPLGALP